MAARTGREGRLTAARAARTSGAPGARVARVARAAGATLAVATLSAGALFVSTLSASPPASAVGSSGKSLSIKTEHVRKVGTVLATQSGFTLYRYTVDPAGKATCTGACAKAWPPLLLPKGVAHIKAPRGVKGLTVVRVDGGRLQVFFHGHALYRFVSDTKKGEASGQGVENDWFAALSNGKSSASQPASTSTTTAGGSASGGGSAATGGGGSATSTTSPATTKTPTTTSGTKSPPTSPPTTAPPTTTPPTTAPPTTTTPTTSPPPTTTTTAPPTGGVGF